MTVSKVTSRIRERIQGRVEQHLIPEPVRSASVPEDLLHRALAAAGAELETIIRIRPDSKGVFVVRHPTHGACVLKTVFGTRHPAAALAGQYRAQLAGTSGSSLFPQVYFTGPFWTLEAYVEGWNFREWMDRRFHPEPVARYFQLLREWSRTTLLPGQSPFLASWQTKEICGSYIRKCLSHSRFFPTVAGMANLRRLQTRRSNVPERVARLFSAAETVEIPTGLMCGDMGNVNLIVAHEEERVVNIDYEFMGIGHWGFDCAYFISSLEKLPHDPATADVIRHAFTDLLDEGQQVQDFFALLTDILTEISATVYGEAW